MMRIRFLKRPPNGLDKAYCTKVKKHNAQSGSICDPGKDGCFVGRHCFCHFACNLILAKLGETSSGLCGPLSLSPPLMLSCQMITMLNSLS